ncbi:uncharacterized protein NDAI_0J01660 [Naumovozyma dairenensis CBS 421]|uniref:Mating factor alpha n=1 Tax=Naumovozyma dairenensis (strain ATCC 10597 / BCRC 20456 / CBS 421 / NBRC 0211 / NRRL Y-12639) TaxID=1071378 RepID=G0WGY0_NAUDC|nr:hypothetical protein NDAI_0J01660 [Naumovozyma dairenensis CBS 421]CCD27058.1 hypothetical protein NDAI_0J01660 [Naumovozyma dairenensis CBS 421]
MKFTTILSAITLLSSSAFAEDISTGDAELPQVPAEAVLGYLDFGSDNDIAMLPFANTTSNGLLFVNTTIVEQANEKLENDPSSLTKREADAEANWHWLRLDPGQPLYKRSADAEAKWHWLRLDPGQPLYKRDAEADAKWHWLRLDAGQPLY